VACEAMNHLRHRNPLQTLKLVHLLKEETFGTLINLSKLKRRQNYRLHDNIITYCMVKCQTYLRHKIHLKYLTRFIINQPAHTNML